jgi:hypothetical protein
MRIKCGNNKTGVRLGINIIRRRRRKEEEGVGK